jgi:hypothetical protein
MYYGDNQKFSAEKTEVYEHGREKFKLRYDQLSTSSVVLIKLGTGNEDTNEILLECFISARSREIPVSRITPVTEDTESVWLQLQTDGPKVKRYNFFVDFTGISGEMEDGSRAVFLMIFSKLFSCFE